MMARILVQTNDYRTVLDERYIKLADINECLGLLDRLEQAVKEAERPPTRRSFGRMAMIDPAVSTSVASASSRTAGCA